MYNASELIKDKKLHAMAQIDFEVDYSQLKINNDN